MKKKNPAQPEKSSIDEINDEALDKVVGGKKATKKKAARKKATRSVNGSLTYLMGRAKKFNDGR